MTTMTRAQSEAMDRIARNGRFGVGPYGGIPWPTAKVLARDGRISITYETNPRTGRRVAYAAVREG